VPYLVASSVTQGKPNFLGVPARSLPSCATG
jgi:hypothetical protein